VNTRHRFRSCLLAALALAVMSPARAAESTAALKDLFKDHFLIGTAVNRSMVTGSAGFRRSADQNAQDVALLKKHFKKITAENDMKWPLNHPRDARCVRRELGFSFSR